jgi:ankyrin repeat protein
METKLNEKNLDEQTKEELKNYLKQWEENNFDLKKFPYCSLLYLAVKFDCEKLTELLIESGFDISDEKSLPLHWAARWGSLKVAGLLLEKGINVDIQNDSGETPLHRAVRYGSKNEKIVKFLAQKGADVNKRDQEGFTPLHCAAYYGDVEIAKSLLEKQAITDVQNKYGETPLHCAAEYGYTQVAETLLKGGADVNVQNKNGETPCIMLLRTCLKSS